MKYQKQKKEEVFMPAKTIMFFLLKRGGFCCLVCLLAFKGVQGSSSTNVLFKALRAHQEDYEAYLLSHSKTISFVDYFQKQRSPVHSQLLELLSLARQKDLQNQVQSARELYAQVMDLFFIGGSWGQRSLFLFVFTAGRLYQLEKNKDVWKRFLQKMLHLHPQWKSQFQHRDFAFLQRGEAAALPGRGGPSWKRQRQGQGQNKSKKTEENVEVLTWDFAKQFPLAEKVLVNGISFSPPSGKALSLFPGFYQFTLLSNTFHPIQAFFHTEDLPSWNPQWIPFLRGSCTRPRFHYPHLKVHPQKSLWFFNMACVRTLAQTTRLDFHLQSLPSLPPLASSDLSPGQDVDLPAKGGKTFVNPSSYLEQSLFSNPVALSSLREGSPASVLASDASSVEGADLVSVSDFSDPSKSSWISRGKGVPKWVWGLGFVGAGVLLLNLKGKSVSLSLPF